MVVGVEPLGLSSIASSSGVSDLQTQLRAARAVVWCRPAVGSTILMESAVVLVLLLLLLPTEDLAFTHVRDHSRSTTALLGHDTRVGTDAMSRWCLLPTMNYYI